MFGKFVCIIQCFAQQANIAAGSFIQSLESEEKWAVANWNLLSNSDLFTIYFSISPIFFSVNFVESSKDTITRFSNEFSWFVCVCVRAAKSATSISWYVCFVSTERPWIFEAIVVFDFNYTPSLYAIPFFFFFFFFITCKNQCHASSQHSRMFSLFSVECNFMQALYVVAVF